MTSPHPVQRNTAADAPLPAYSRWENRSSAPHDGQRRRGLLSAGGSLGIGSSVRGPARDDGLVIAVRRPPELTPPVPEGQRPASVLLLCDPATPGVPLLFVLRSEELRQHPGQIAFPGGGAETFDSDVVATALREAGEELGIQSSSVEVLGLLTTFSTVVSGRWLTPVVGLQRGPIDFKADDFEIAEWFRIDIADLLVAPHTVRELERNGMHARIHYYEASGRVIWGVTGAILHELLQRLGRTD
jgi:8-oxo-dGTP pyrophosphatase MutT (NUDIX family)